MRTESFSVEGEDASGQLSLIGYCDEAGKPLNPCASLESAQLVLTEILDIQRRDPRMTWKNIQIIKTTRESV